MCIIVKCENNKRDERSIVVPVADVAKSLLRSCFYHMDIPKGDQGASTYKKSCLDSQEIKSWLNTPLT